jgi:hypothetical protein
MSKTHDFEFQEEGVIYRMTLEAEPDEHGVLLRVAQVLDAWEAETLSPLELTRERESLARLAAERRSSYIWKVMKSL